MAKMRIGFDELAVVLICGKGSSRNVIWQKLVSVAHATNGFRSWLSSD